jgi:hypothetical protein
VSPRTSLERAGKLKQHFCHYYTSAITTLLPLLHFCHYYTSAITTLLPLLHFCHYYIHPYRHSLDHCFWRVPFHLYRHFYRYSHYKSVSPTPNRPLNGVEEAENIIADLSTRKQDLREVVTKKDMAIQELENLKDLNGQEASLLIHPSE